VPRWPLQRSSRRQQIYEQLDAIIETVRAIEPDAAVALHRTVHQVIIMEADLDWLSRYVVMADGFAYRWQWTWMDLARAWLLVKLTAEGARDAPSKLEMSGYLQFLQTASEDAVRKGIVALLLNAQLGRDASKHAVSCLTDASRNAWDPALFTDPLQHRVESYCYIINALRPVTLTITVASEIDYLRRHRPAYISPCPSQRGAILYNLTRYYLSDPDAITSEVLSCSIISHAKHATYQNMSFGFILHVPKANICNAAAVDLVAASVQNTARAMHLAGLPTYGATGSYKKVQKLTDFLSEIAGKARPNIPSPATVLGVTSAHGHNELIVLGTFMGQVRARAIFVKVTRGRLWRSFVADDEQHGLTALIFACARDRRIPVIPIVDDSGQASNVEFVPWCMRGYGFGGEPRVMQSTARDVIGASRQLVVDPRFPAVHLSLGQARAFLAHELNVSPLLDLASLRQRYRAFALTHHPDRTKDTDKHEKFVTVRGLLTIVEGEETGTREPLRISWKKQLHD